MSHRAIYLIVGGVLALLLVVMLITYNYNKKTEEALAKAEQLITALDEAGLRTPADPNNVDLSRYEEEVFHQAVAEALEAVERGEIPPRPENVLVNSYAFGGNNVSVIFGRADGGVSQ